MGSVAWSAISDANLNLRRAVVRTPKPGESGDGPSDADTRDDGTRILEGTSRWDGPLRYQLAYRDGRYTIGAGEASVTDRVRTFLDGTLPGPQSTSQAAIAAGLRIRPESVGDAVKS